MRPALRILAPFVASAFVLASAPRPARADVMGKVDPVPYPQAQAAARVPAAPGDDVVHLKDGGMIRGTLLDAIPNDHATVQLATGESARIPWNLIQSIERGAKSTAAPGAVSVDDRGAPAAWVHVDSESQVALESREAGGEWRYACSAPCDRALPLAPEYRISGSGIRNSGAFHLAARPGERIVVQVNASSKGGFVGGIVMVSLGPVVMVIGLVVIMVSAVEDTAICLDSTTSCNSSTAKHSDGGTVGAVLLVGGAIMTVAGIVMLVSNAHSHVAQEPYASGRPRDDAWLRLPTWREDPSAAGMPRAASVPVFHTAF